MKLDELFNTHNVSVGVALEEAFIRIFDDVLLEDEGDGPGDMSDLPPPNSPPPTPPYGGGWGHGPVMGGPWFNQLYASLKQLVVAQNILKRLGVLGLNNSEGKKRVKNAAKIAAKHVKLLMSNPGAVAYRIPVWTTAGAPKFIIKKMNEEFTKVFEEQLRK